MVNRANYKVLISELRQKKPPDFGTCLPNRIVTTKATAPMTTLHKKHSATEGPDNQTNTKKTFAGYKIPHLPKADGTPPPQELEEHSSHTQEFCNNTRTYYREVFNMLESIDYIHREIRRLNRIKDTRLNTATNLLKGEADRISFIGFK